MELDLPEKVRPLLMQKVAADTLIVVEHDSNFVETNKCLFSPTDNVVLHGEI